jgi:hypothetical protein
MPTRKQVQCINKKGSHDNAHERIQNLGGVHAGVRWNISESRAILNMKSGSEEYFVLVNGRSVEVIIATYIGKEYLKTKDDGYAPNNLLSLPECPA